MKNFNMSIQILDATYICQAVNTKRMVFRVRKAATGEKGRNGLEKDADYRRKGSGRNERKMKTTGRKRVFDTMKKIRSRLFFICRSLSEGKVCL